MLARWHESDVAAALVRTVSALEHVRLYELATKTANRLPQALTDAKALPAKYRLTAGGKHFPTKD